MKTKNNMTLIGMFLLLSACSLDTTSEPDVEPVTTPVINTPAILSGDLDKSVQFDDTTDVTGTVIITDPDTAEDRVDSQVSLATTYGVFSIQNDGSWVYTLTTSNADVMALDGTSDTLTDMISVKSADGVTAQINITITGKAPDPVAATTKVLKITDTDSSDSGELRHKLANPLAAGKITARFLKEEVLTDGGSAKEAYIALWGSSTSTNNALVDLRIGNGTFQIRNASTSVTQTFTLEEWVDVEMTWDATDTTAAPLVTVKINGVDSGLGTFSSFSNDLSSLASGVEKLVFKLSDNGSTVNGAVYYDDIKVYSDTAGTALEWSEDFEGFDSGYDLSVTYDDSATNEAFVAEVSTGLVDTNAPSNVLRITDTDSSDSGELRHKLANPLATGTITARFLKEEVLTDGGSAKEAYIALWGSSTSTNNALVDLRIGNGTFQIRNASTSVTQTFTLEEWVNVEMTWDATDTTAAPLVTVKINGVDSGLGTFSSFSNDLSSIASGVEKLVFKLSDNGSTVNGAVYYDDIKVYSDTAATALEWSEDFEGFASGYDLSVTYNDSATNEAFVAVK
ncbi:VCBS domain-containing protein [Catenovulum maritimum]|uniref:Cadherin domain-containing protein n=1 Tax=Catenovulum maritimum TaxID=1513271 RepID=A0A0J8GZP3_9ALTE|nr:VCBS domain-containing protein [Catenovulum maritimum]KMT66704.1 hypothetical protein XM47_00805 [Catenovulum maritimum]